MVGGFTLKFLSSAYAAKARMEERKPSFVVHAGGDDDLYVELDAVSFENAVAIARSWRTHFNANETAIRRVNADGSLGYPLQVKRR
jgi:hypothetical protein